MNPAGKQKLISFFISILILGGLVLILAFTYLSFTLPPDDEFDVMGVPVMYGNVEDAFGDTEPLGAEVDDSEEYYVEQQVVDGDDYYEDSSLDAHDLVQEEPQEVIVQEEEITVPVQNTKTKDQIEKERLLSEQRKETDRLAKIEAEKIAKEKIAKEKAETEARKAAENKAKVDKQMQSVFGSPDGQAGGSRGDTQGTGMQGVPTGNASHGATSGIGYNGSYSLQGRTLGRGKLVDPKYNVDDYGKVVVDIVVDPSGNVIEAMIGKGSTALSATLVNEALKAAKKNKFNEVNSLVNQKGTITFVFGYE